MSIPVAAFRFLLSRDANALLKAQIVTHVETSVTTNKASIERYLSGWKVTGAVLVTDSHPSKSDPIEHFTVDLYGYDMNGIEEPIGTAHVYNSGDVKVFDTPRGKATAAYDVRVSAYRNAVQNGAGVI